MCTYKYVYRSNPSLVQISTCAFSSPDSRRVDDAEGMKQENEFPRITLISLRSPTSGAPRLGKPPSRQKLLFSESRAGGESIRRLW